VELEDLAGNGQRTRHSAAWAIAPGPGEAFSWISESNSMKDWYSSATLAPWCVEEQWEIGIALGGEALARVMIPRRCTVRVQRRDA